MEFTELHELNRVLTYRQPAYNPYEAAPDSPDRAVEENLEDCLHFSPQKTFFPELDPSIFEKLCQNLEQSESSEEEVDNSNQNQVNEQSAQSPQKQSSKQEIPFQNEKESEFEVTRETDFEEPNQQKDSTLSKSLERSLTQQINANINKTPKTIINKTEHAQAVQQSQGDTQLTIFYFGKPFMLKVSVNKSDKVELIIKAALQAYANSEFQQQLPLKHKEVEGYELWLAEDNQGTPDTDFKVESNRIVQDLAGALVITEIQGYEYEKEIDEVESSLERAQTVIQNQGIIVVKIILESNEHTILRVEKKTKLRDLLAILERKGAGIEAKLSPDLYHFKLSIQTQKGIEECYPDMNISVGMLDLKELKLEKKKFADAPSEVKKQPTVVIKEQEEVRYDPLLFHITKAQAAVYKEYPVIKTNKRGRRQQRILGIDKNILYNFKKDKANQPVRVQQNQGFLQKLQGTKRPYIYIMDIKSVYQSNDNLKAFIVEHKEGNAMKQRQFEATTSAIAAAIVAKLNKLMQMSMEIS